MAVDYLREGDVAVVTLARPHAYNAVDGRLADELVEALERAGREARAAVVTGEGKAFCSGADLRDLADDYRSGVPDLARVIEERFHPVAAALAAVEVPTVAALNGAAAGAGLGIALACDLRVLSSEAYFMSAFINVALIPDTGSSWYLARLVGLGRALEIAYSGRKVEAGEALRIGLAHRVVEPQQVRAEAVAWAGGLAEGPVEAYVATRRLLHQSGSASLDEALAQERRLQGELGGRPAHLEGVRAFMEKRPPDFRSAG
ncbi:MAG: enoyl-CoA hydratase-related protein [Actinomycetota bacterium]|nr:enoyl-CoA hydratase-related protein [Actinomycetota bacterium]